MGDNTFKILEEFVKKEVLKHKELSRQTDIRADLKLRGDDAIDFVLAYGKQFNVDLSGFMAADYIEDEGMNLFFKEDKKKLTLGDLEKGIIAGKLNEEVITG